MRRAALLLAVLAGCAERDAERAVRDYNTELVRAFGLNDSSRMRTVALQKEADRVLVLQDLKASSRLALESTLERFDVTSSKASPDGNDATVETAERWRYFDRPLTPGRAAGPTVVSEMKMRYDLAREEGRFKVRDVTTLANEILEPKGYIIGGHKRDGGFPRVERVRADGGMPP